MPQQRPYRGKSAQERISERRERLLSSAMEMFSKRGYTATTIEQLCASAKVSTRAFYECFESREDVLLTLHNQILDEAAEAVEGALSTAGPTLEDQIRAKLSAYIRYMTEDPRRARIAHVELTNLPDPLTRQRREADFVRVVLTANASDERDPQVDLGHLALGLIGAGRELLVDWAQSKNPPSPEKLVATSEHLFLAALDRASRPAPEIPTKIRLPEQRTASATKSASGEGKQ